MLPELAKAIEDRLSVLVDQPSGGRVMQERRDGWLAFQKNSASWVQGTTSAWSKARSSPLTTSSSRYTTSGTLELMGNEVMEDKIIASRLALRLLDFASWELSDLRVELNTQILAGKYNTPLGVISFDKEGEVQQKDFYVAQIKMKDAKTGSFVFLK